MNSTDDPYFSTLVGPRTHCFQFVKISLAHLGVLHFLGWFGIAVRMQLGLTGVLGPELTFHKKLKCNAPVI